MEDKAGKHWHPCVLFDLHTHTYIHTPPPPSPPHLNKPVKTKRMLKPSDQEQTTYRLPGTFTESVHPGVRLCTLPSFLWERCLPTHLHTCLTVKKTKSQESPRSAIYCPPQQHTRSWPKMWLLVRFIFPSQPFTCTYTTNFSFSFSIGVRVFTSVCMYMKVKGIQVSFILSSEKESFTGVEPLK